MIEKTGLQNGRGEKCRYSHYINIYIVLTVLQGSKTEWLRKKFEYSKLYKKTLVLLQSQLRTEDCEVSLTYSGILWDLPAPPLGTWNCHLLGPNLAKTLGRREFTNTDFKPLNAMNISSF